MPKDDRLVQTGQLEDEEQLERSIRPKRFADYIGQTGVTDQLKVYIEAAKMRGESPGPGKDHPRGYNRRGDGR